MSRHNRKVPHARRDAMVRRVHGIQLSDPYGWMQDRKADEVRAHLDAENEYTDTVLAPSAELHGRLFDEMVGRIRETDATAPYLKRGYWYYVRTEAGKEYPMWCRRQETLDAPEEVLLDGNLEAKKFKFFEVGSMSVSPDGSLLAYGVDVDGSERHRVVVRRIETGEIVETVTTTGGHSLVWSAHGQFLFYDVLDDTQRPYRLYRHRTGSPQGQDELVYEESDGRFYLTAHTSRDRQMIFIGVKSNTTTEYRWIPSNDPKARPRLIMARREQCEYYPEHRNGEFILRTNREAPDFAVVSCPIETVDDVATWNILRSHVEGVRIVDLMVFKNHIALFERERGGDRIRVVEFESGQSHIVDMPQEVYSLELGPNFEYDTQILRFHFSSPIIPETVYDYEMNSRTLNVVKVQEVPSGHDPGDYVCRRLWVESHDGVQVPVTVFYRRSLRFDGSNPGYLYGYGSYGYTVEPRFRSSWYSLVDRGFVCAIAHVRGGGMLGEAWHQAGKLGNKKNTFHDFIAVAEYLVESGFVGAGKLGIQGGSAGGLLMGAVLNMRPDLFRVAVADVPFVDVINTMMDETLPLTKIEYEEWGDPATREAFEYMASYSPYDNVVGKEYPDLLVTAGLNDPRVQYWEPAKWVARLRSEAQHPDRVVLLKTNMESGHGGASGRYELIREQALAFSFIISRVL